MLSKRHNMTGRCSISYLLNDNKTDTMTTDQENMKTLESLVELEHYLQTLIITLMKADSWNEDLSTLEDELFERMTILSHVNKQSRIAVTEQSVLSNINKLTNCVLFLLTECRALKRTLHAKEEEMKADYAGISEAIQPHIAYQSPSDGSPQAIPYERYTQRGRRLPSNSVKILNDWYQKNIEKPYLSNEVVLDLMQKTGFTHTQVRNWVSNQRRKDKSTSISDVLRPILDE